MNREIKFRGQRIDNNEWIYGYYVKDPKGQHRIYLQPFENSSSNTYYFVKPETAGQFTGLLDKNGKDVFEGDILRFHFDLGIAYVINDGFRFGVKSPGSKAIDYESAETIQQCEIIGNIHENPEL